MLREVSGVTSTILSYLIFELSLSYLQQLIAPWSRGARKSTTTVNTSTRCTLGSNFPFLHGAKVKKRLCCIWSPRHRSIFTVLYSFIIVQQRLCLLYFRGRLIRPYKYKLCNLPTVDWDIFGHGFNPATRKRFRFLDWEREREMGSTPMEEMGSNTYFTVTVLNLINGTTSPVFGWAFIRPVIK